MRRLLPALLCVAASTGLTACDQPVSPDDERELYNEVRKAPAPMPKLADGDVILSRTTLEGQKDPVFVIVGQSARTSLGLPIQALSDSDIASPDGELLCTKGSSGGFVQLVDADGTVLLSTVGPFVFEGQPDLAGKNPGQQAQELASRLRFSYDFDTVMEGFANSGQAMVEADVPVQFSSGWRKLVIASLVDGYCGSDGLPE
jgi:hypothetical protein